MRKVNWRRRFNDIEGVLEQHFEAVSTAQIRRDLKKWGIPLGISAIHATLCSMQNTQRVLRFTVKGKDYWVLPTKKGMLVND